MNGKDGKPFKTREGGVLRLEYLLKEVTDAVYEKSKANSSGNISDEELHSIAEKVALAAIKYGDLSNQPSKDYVFDVDRFTAFEGNTGPYIMYTMVRIKSCLLYTSFVGGEGFRCDAPGVGDGHHLAAGLGDPDRELTSVHRGGASVAGNFTLHFAGQGEDCFPVAGTLGGSNNGLVGADLSQTLQHLGLTAGQMVGEGAVIGHGG